MFNEIIKDYFNALQQVSLYQDRTHLLRDITITSNSIILLKDTDIIIPDMAEYEELEDNSSYTKIGRINLKEYTRFIENRLGQDYIITAFILDGYESPWVGIQLPIGKTIKEIKSLPFSYSDEYVKCV